MNINHTHAQPALEFIPPALNSLVLGITKSVLPLWLNLGTNIVQIEGNNVEHLVQLYQQFQQGKIRFLMAFRHPSTNDPLCMAYLVWKLLGKTAQQQGISLQSPLHAHFIYDRGIPLWAGDAIGWLYSRLGGTSIQRGKLDLMGLKSARNLFAHSHIPIAASPEGATNGHNEIISPLEPGIAQLGFWCVDDLRKEKRSEEVLIIPIGIQYFYLTPPWIEIDKLLTQLEKDSGLTVNNQLINPSVSDINVDELYQRLIKLAEHILSLMEKFYTRFYHQSIPSVTTNNTNEIISIRLNNLLNIALQVAEEYFKIKPKGNFIDRCRRLEQAGWDYIYREELKSNNILSPVERGLADFVAEEASLRMWHMRIVESFVSVSGNYVKQKPTGERFAETLLLLWDLVARIKGDNPFSRPKLGKQKVIISMGEPLSVSQRWQQYKSDRRQAIDLLTQDLQTTLDQMIINS